jgi:glycosyltransferase involved in cell wall biosynthesis
MTPARILHLRASNFVGGPENQLLRHASKEQGGRWDVWIAVYVNEREGKELLSAAQARGIPSVSLPVESITASIRRLRRILKENDIKLICTHGYKSQVIGLLARMLTGIPVACFLRGWTGENFKVKIYEAVERVSLAFADRVVCLSNLQAKKISGKHSWREKIRVVRNAIDMRDPTPKCRQQSRELLTSRLSLPDHTIVVATAGRLSPEKGIGDFLDAVCQVRADRENVVFVIFGEGALEKTLKEKAKSLGLSDKVIFAGFHRDLRNLLPGIDILVNASQSEEMPNVVLEAMAAAVPVVATEVGGVAEIAGAEPAIRLVPPGKPDLLAREISSLLSAPDLGRSLGLEGFERVKQAFSVESQTAEFDSLYRELVPVDTIPSRETRAPVMGS